MSLILPSAFRQALSFMIDNNLMQIDDQDNTWPSKFIKFIRGSLKIEVPENIRDEQGFIDHEEKEDFINNVFFLIP